ncbi:transglutaminase domain-containing protein [Microbacterium gorillae]|uniref:transglutaminase domain-containing protein n=1 Tax=Microbacterium gorillae TaxID=1231063 RepID=UPI000693B11B|nr:transglutaminase domain-containing protein [Microbacterium gorillae]
MNTRSVIAGGAYVAVMAALGLVAVWPIYQSLAVVWIVLAASLVGAAVAALSVRYRWPWWGWTAALVGGWLLIGIGLGIPARWAGGSVWPGGVVDVLTAPILGFKDLATVPLPVGEYRNLLVVAGVVFLVAVFVAVRRCGQSSSRAAWAVPVAALMPVFGLVFGRTSTSSPLRLGGFELAAPVETATGAAALLASVGWLAWRARDSRRSALHRAAEATGIVRRRAATTGAMVRRGALAAGMIVVALIVGIVVTPTLADARPRTVLRTAVGPEISDTDALSPLATYRNRFRDDTYETPLFSITANGPLPDRVRIATLVSYDGTAYRASTGEDGAFQRVPSRLSTPAGTEATATITIAGLGGVWVPSFGSLATIDFTAGDAPTLADRFYYDAGTQTALESAGLNSGDAYRMTAVIPTVPDLATVASPNAAATVQPPPNLERWLEEENPAHSGAGLVEVIGALRERGYLSHALSIDEGEPPLWMRDLDGYTFRSSASGHSLARVDQLFRQLLERESQAAEQGAGASLVAAVGDDEQFAVASAIIAQSLGFPSRVVVGVRTSAEGQDLPACTDGTCTSGDVSAWLEVQDADGLWHPLDTTPQHSDDVQTKTKRERDPEVPTTVRPRSAQEVAPPDPLGQQAAESPDDPNGGADLGALWQIVRIAGLSLLGLIIVLAPFLGVLIAKVLRRRSRRGDPDRARAVAGGWEEYVDAAVDAGHPAPSTQTRHELAALYATPSGPELATRADHAVFSGTAVADDEASRFWEIVGDERRALSSDLGWWRRVRAALSLKSFTRRMAARPRPASSTRSERRTRRDSDV